MADARGSRSGLRSGSRVPSQREQLAAARSRPSWRGVGRSLAWAAWLGAWLAGASWGWAVLGIRPGAVAFGLTYVVVSCVAYVTGWGLLLAGALLRTRLDEGR